jgi:hypothetical protein
MIFTQRKVKFFYKVKEDLMVGGPIYNDFKESCKGQIGDDNMTEETWATYMEAAWNACLTHHVQKRALSSKRSGVYTVMQSTFSGELECDMDVTRYKQQDVLTNQYDIKICLTFVTMHMVLSLESIQRRLENPKSYYYYVFYLFFYKADVGET